MEETPEMAQETQVSVRLPAELVEKAEALVERLRENPENRLLGLTRATLLRLAIARGLEAIDIETAAKGKAR